MRRRSGHGGATQDLRRRSLEVRPVVLRNGLRRLGASEAAAARQRKVMTPVAERASRQMVSSTDPNARGVGKSLRGKRKPSHIKSGSRRAGSAKTATFRTSWRGRLAASARRLAQLSPEVPSTFRGPELTSWTPRTRILAGSGIFAASTASSRSPSATVRKINSPSSANSVTYGCPAGPKSKGTVGARNTRRRRPRWEPSAFQRPVSTPLSDAHGCVPPSPVVRQFGPASDTSVEEEKH